MKSDIAALSPYIRFASDGTIQAPFCIGEREIFDYELLYVKGGGAEITHGGVTASAGPGDIFLIKPGTPHTIKSAGGRSLHQPHVHFDLVADEKSPEIPISFRGRGEMDAGELALFREDITAPGRELELPFRLHVESVPHFEKLLFAVIGEYESRAAFSGVLRKARFLELFYYLLEENRRLRLSAAGHPEAYERIRQYIEESYKKPLCLDGLSERFHISKYHLHRRYLELYGHSPVAHARGLRMERARELLAYTGLGVGQIASELGFESISAFSRVFRRVQGLSPTDYRGGRR